MRTIISSAAFMLFLAGSAFGAIEFSEDQVAATASTTSGLVVGSTANSGNLTAPNAIAAMAQTQSSGASGSVGSIVGLSVPRTAPTRPLANAGMIGGGGGGNNNNNGAPVTSSPTALALAGPTGTAPTNPTSPPSTGTGVPPGPGAIPGAGAPVPGVSPVALPEPSTMVVWSVLGLLGLVALRRRNK